MDIDDMRIPSRTIDYREETLAQLEQYHKNPLACLDRVVCLIRLLEDYMCDFEFAEEFNLVEDMLYSQKHVLEGKVATAQSVEKINSAVKSLLDKIYEKRKVVGDLPPVVIFFPRDVPAETS